MDARAAGSSFAWSAASFGGSKVLVFLITLVMARLLSPEDFGVVSVGLTIVASQRSPSTSESAPP